MLQGMTNTYPSSLFHCYQDPGSNVGGAGVTRCGASNEAGVKALLLPWSLMASPCPRGFFFRGTLKPQKIP